MSSQSQQVPESADDDSHLSRSVGGRESLQVPQDLPGKDLYAMLSSASTSVSHDGSGLSNSVPGKLSFAALRQRRNKVIVHGENESTGSSSADRYSSQSPLTQQKYHKQSSQPAEKKTEHIIVETTAGLYFIISKLSTRKDVQLISIEPKLGTLKYKHRPQEDLFDTLEEALSHIEVTLELTIKTKTTACALLGYVVLENMGCLLVATKVTTDGEFFWGHNVYTVSESSWIKIPLTYPAPQNTNEITNFETLSEFQLDGLHYYCETYDMTRPFPSFRDPWE